MTVSFFLSLAIQVYFWYGVFGALHGHSTETSSSKPDAPVSIIVCAYNAYSHLSKNLPFIINQHYPLYEVILQDDHSTDGTAEKVKMIDNEKRILSVYKVNQKVAGKKQALLEGIDHARHNWLLMTDADCRPVSKNWISSMMAAQNTDSSDKIKIILGYSPYDINGTNVGYWSHFEAWITALQYLSFAIKGYPYMGVGRNMLYRKELLSENTITKYAHIASGDDDLTIMEIASSENTAISLNPDSYVSTQCEPSWSAYYKQKQRHFSTSSLYKTGTKLRLSLYSGTQVLFYALFFALLFTSAYKLALVGYLFRMLMLLPKVNSLKEKLQAKFKLWHFLFLDLGQAFYYVIFSFAVLFPQKQNW